MLGNGLSAKPGEVVEVSEAVAHAVISVGRGELLQTSAPAEGEPPAVSAVEVREPEVEARDPQPAKAKKRGE